jgi:diphosphomevalonate decarboxylase
MFLNENDLQYWISEHARMGSGSAIRSSLLQSKSPFVMWEKHRNEQGGFSSVFPYNDYDIRWQQCASCVLVINEEEKSVSSSDGHTYAKSSPFYEIRKSKNNEILKLLLLALKTFDWNLFIHCVEYDALQLHAIMQTCSHEMKWLDHELSHIISQLIAIRTEKHIPFAWTLDAGRNIHIIGMSDTLQILEPFIREITDIILKRSIRIIHNTSHQGLILK